MRNIKACGPGCKRCKTTEETVKTAAAKRGVGGSLEKVTAPPRAIALATVMNVAFLPAQSGRDHREV